MNKENLVTIPSGSVLAKEQTEALYELAKMPIDINEEFLDKFNSIGCTSFQVTAKELKEIMEGQNNAMDKTQKQRRKNQKKICHSSH